MRIQQTPALLFSTAVAAFGLGGCDLAETCDPALDPTCVIVTDGGVDAGSDAISDTGSPDTPTTGCGALGEGQTRCRDESTMESCEGGALVPTTCDGVCQGTSCAEAVRYVRIVDLTLDPSGQHPGADVDAIALISGGQTFYAEEVTDSFVPSGVSNLAPDVTESLGPPDEGGATCDLTDGAEHWVSLAGGELVVRFAGGRSIRSGDQITVYECAGAAADAFDITVGVSARLEGDWETLLEEATGTITVTVP